MLMDFLLSNAPNIARKGLRAIALLLSCGLPAVAVHASAQTAAASSSATASAASTMPREAQRKAFIQAYASAERGDPAWRKQAAGLKNYPLYPYLQAAALENQLRTVTRAQVERYLNTWPDMLPADDLRRDFLHELARRRDWAGFNALYRPGLGATLTCDHLQGKLAAGQRLDFDRDLAGLWQHTALPADCDPVLAWAHDHKLLTRKRLWERIDRAVKAGRGGTVAALAQWLHGNEAMHAKRLAQALRQPAQAAAAAVHWPDDTRNRQAAAIALQRLARKSSTGADALWPKLRRHLHFTASQRHDIEHDIALFTATDFTSDAIQRLRHLPKAAQSDATRSWRLRVALARRDWQGVIDAYAAMPPAQQQDSEWRYFHARALGALGHKHAADKAYADLADQTTYFGFLAADRLNEPYTICPAHVADAPIDETALLANPGLNRAFELFAVHLPKLARREWVHALRGASADTRHLAAMLAYQRGWYDRAIFTFSSGDALKLYDQRFPLARQDRVSEQAKDAGIDPAWAYALIRAESAWVTDARSGADAYGLMQLLPSTARVVAKQLKLPFGGAEDLYDPKLNIALGTHYLANMATRYGGAPWLASAAYNAGPQQVDKWLAARGDLPPDIFVATIPFHETREYVARVMAFSVLYDWRLHQRTVPLSQRMPRFGKPYTPPNAKTPREPVQCPSAPAKTSPAAASSVAP
ncbi:transglycosylase SLT domain-containing protein [Oleiagrimonas soli]|uniref:Soluble lytic murein transglycosylase n=1 Tax=Oleiagrimonas soli TaxID=1543381 RepID=A0A841KHB3_9GAMM|nr:transglycosylase SLT domain-containing protein [Oleiagrimonas soli]MBB6184445.1 soluble lytic murein transglycosylase [Oleiagrimonas soli]